MRLLQPHFRQMQVVDNHVNSNIIMSQQFITMHILGISITYVYCIRRLQHVDTFANRFEEKQDDDNKFKEEEMTST